MSNLFQVRLRKENETQKFNDDNSGGRGDIDYVVVFISNSSSVLCCQKLPCICRTAWRNQPAGPTNRIRGCLLHFASTKAMLRSLSKTKQRISILKINVSENKPYNLKKNY